MKKYSFTSESVTEGHPDKMADQISDSVLDAILAEDPAGRVACETLLTTGLCVIAGEITTSAYVDIPNLARQVINGIGYDNALYGFDGNTCGVIVIGNLSLVQFLVGKEGFIVLILIPSFYGRAIVVANLDV